MGAIQRRVLTERLPAGHELTGDAGRHEQTRLQRAVVVFVLATCSDAPSATLTQPS
jgi:hypothetical protein